MGESVKKGLIVLSILIIGAAFGRFTAPSKVEEREKIVYKDRIVEKKIYVTDKSQKNNKVTIRLVTIKPDGTKTIETKIFDKSEIDIVQNGSSTNIRESETSKETEKVVEYSRNDFLILFGAKRTFDNPTFDYGIFLEKRLLGPIYGGAFAFTDKSGGIALGLAF